MYIYIYIYMYIYMSHIQIVPPVQIASKSNQTILFPHQVRVSRVDVYHLPAWTSPECRR